jgi:predicted nuclease of predicted toxin-antitoxin system
MRGSTHRMEDLPPFSSTDRSLSQSSLSSSLFLCPICHRKFDEFSALEQHTKAVHVEKGMIPYFDSIQANRLRPLSCQLCQRHFPDLNALEQHRRTKHSIARLLVDENVSASEPAVRQLRYVYHTQIQKLPHALCGRSDEELLQYARSHKMGLITRDKRCARVAVQYLSPVYLLVNEKGYISVVKFN